MAISFRGAHFPQDIMLMGVRWYVAYPLSYRHMGVSGRAMIEALIATQPAHIDFLDDQIEALSAAIQTWLGTLSATEVSPSPQPRDGLRTRGSRPQTYLHP